MPSMLKPAELGQIETTISQTTSIPIITTINLLPTEILAHIFELVLDAEHCYFYQRNRTRPSVFYPEALSHVCSRWRYVAINSRVLWSHIDLELIPPRRRACAAAARGLLARAKTFEARTAHAPLDIHIKNGRYILHDCDTDVDLNAFCASIATRTRSLGLSARYSLTKAHFAALRDCVEECMPGTLRQLVIITGFSYSLDSTVAENPNNDFKLPYQFLEDLLLPVKVLCLSGVHFPWTSQVYHGLVELRLTQSRMHENNLSIPHSHLLNILVASPGLRIFHFRLHITELVPHNTPSSSVSLRFLEEVDLQPESPDQYNVLLQLLSPGSNPLQLSLAFPEVGARYKWLGYEDSPPFKDLFTNEFFSRSMVTELRIHFDPYRIGRCVSTPLLSLFRSLPLQGLQVLFISNFSLTPHRPEADTPSPSAIDLNEPELSLTYTQLHTLHLSCCTIELDDFRQATRAMSIQVLKVSACSVLWKAGPLGEGEVERELARIFPAQVQIDRSCFGTIERLGPMGFSTV